MNFLFNDNIRKMAGYTPGYQPDSPSAIKLNTNENPYPASPKVFEALANLTAKDLKVYPPFTWKGFRKVASELHGVSPDQIICGNGGDELLSMLVRACCDSHRPLAYPTPTYSLYPVLAHIQNCPIIEIPWSTGYSIPDTLATCGAKLAIICNPNAPTCSFISPEKIAEFAEKFDGVLLIDEAYADFAEDNCIRLLNSFENIAILRSFSKGYSMAGMRFGYLLTSRLIADALLKVKDSYNVNIATQKAAIAALTDQDYFLDNVAKIKSERERVTLALRNLGFDVPDSHTNFLLAKIEEPAAKFIYERLVENEIYIRYFDADGLRDKVRISIGTPEENNALLQGIVDILGK